MSENVLRYIHCLTVLKEIDDSRNIVVLLQLQNLLQLLVRKQIMTTICFLFVNKYDMYRLILNISLFFRYYMQQFAFC